MTFRLARLMVLCAAVLAFAAPSSAQVYTGRVDVSVTDSTGAILPNVTVTLTGPHDATQVTDAKGEVHFLGLPPGIYTVSAKLEGFQEYKNTSVEVVTGGTVPLKAALAVGGVATQVDVRAESPTIDPKKLTTSTNVTQQELQNVPSSRDPWVVLQTVPGIIVDRVNVGGAESGQQSGYQAKGAAGGDNTWNMDGVAITDMAALGSSPTYYDFDMFQEMQVTTGGADLQNPTPGVQLNFVLKGGSNTPHGSTRLYYEDEGMQANNLPDDLKASLGGTTGKGNRINKYSDYGFEIGGPIMKDKLWAWGSLGKTDVTLLTLSNTPDQTILKNQAFKTTGQATSAVRGVFSFFRGDKNKYGRNAGPLHPPETTWNQKGPTPVYKGEGNFVLGNNLFLTGRYSYVGGGFSLTPQGGLDKPYFVDDGGVFRGSYVHYETVRPQWAGAADGNWFKGRHEIKFGFGWRRADVDSSSIIPGGSNGLNGIVTYHVGYPVMTAEVGVWNDTTFARGQYSSAYVGDTMTWDRLTLTAGLRWDRQAGSVKAATQTGNPLLPSLLPDVKSSARSDVIVWNSVTPRIGLSYALDDARKTLLRASYGTFASQLNATAGNFMSTVAYRGVYFYDVIDTNGNKLVDPAEIAGRTCSDALANAGACGWYGFDIANPGNVSSPIHKVGDYKTPLTHEVLFGVDRELARNFGVSATFTWRNFTHFTWRNNGVVGTNYQQIGTFAGSNSTVGSFSVPVYGAILSSLPANRAATTYRERDGYSQRYLGFEASATKRLSDRWMARFGFSTNDHREYFDSVAAMTDPTPSAASPNKDGGLVVRQSGGSGKSGIYQLLPKYQFIATGMYQAAWGINLAANMVNRQGFSRQYFQANVPTSATAMPPGDPLAARKSVLLVETGEFRLPSVTSLDFRVGKEFAFQRARLNFDLDVFNLFNSATVLGRQYDLSRTNANNVLEIMNPRVVRLGVRFGF
jgi:carboxypeptidase family protein/TonB-dependent receptor-like protein